MERTWSRAEPGEEEVSESLQPWREMVVLNSRGQPGFPLGCLSHAPTAQLIIAYYVLNLGTAGPGSGIASHQSELFKGAESWPLG
jgi:hypothetical protein